MFPDGSNGWLVTVLVVLAAISVQAADLAWRLVRIRLRSLLAIILPLFAIACGGMVLLFRP